MIQLLASLDGDHPGVHIISMLKTFAAPDEDRFVEDADLQDLDGRLVWDETEIELCAVGTRSAGVGTAQIGDLFPTTEESCGPAVVEWR